MKKQWNTPNLEVLDVENTFGRGGGGGRPGGGGGRPGGGGGRPGGGGGRGNKPPKS